MKTNNAKGILAVGLAAFVMGGVAYGADPYIESTGASGISTGYRMKGSSRVEVDFQMMAVGNALRVFGSYGGGSSSYEMSLLTTLYLSDTHFNFVVGPWNQKVTKYKAGTDTDRHTAIIDLPNDRLVFMTGSTTNVFTDGRTATWSGLNFTGMEADLPLSLFARVWNSSATDFANISRARIYGVKIYENDKIVRDFVPCLKEGVACFKDVVNGGFIVGENVAAFTVGGDNVPTYDDDGYVSTAVNGTGGRLYFDTGHIVTPNTAVAIDCALAYNCSPTEGGVAMNGYLFDSYPRFYLNFAQYINASNYGLRYANAFSGITSSTNAFSASFPQPVDDKDIRRTFFIDNHNRVAGVVTSGFTNQAMIIESTSQASSGSITLKLSSAYGGNDGSLPLKIYGCKIWEEGVLVKDYVPYVTNGVPGLFDSVSGKFLDVSRHSSDTTSTLAYGGAIKGEQDAYLESNGTTGLNTGCKINGNSRLEVDFAMIDSSGSGRVFGSYGGGTSSYESSLLTTVYLNGGTHFNFVVGPWDQKVTKYKAGVDTDRHTAIIDLPNDRLVFMTGSTTNAFTDGNLATWTGLNFAGKESDLPLSLFARFWNAAGTSYANVSKARIYSVRIYELGTLAHEFLPYGGGAVTGLYDTVTGDVISNGTSFKFGGAGHDHGSLKAYIKPGYSTKLAHRGTTMLTAYAPGANSYKWLMDGQPIAGGTDGVLSAEWARGGTKTEDGYAHTYQAIAVYDNFYGVTQEGEPSASATITSDLLGMTIIVK